jgi:hypothetical protein
VADLAGRDQLGDRPDALLDRDLAVHPRQVVEVDRLDPEAAKRGVDRLAQVGGAAVDVGPVGAGPHAGLGCDHEPRAAARDRAPDELLAAARAVVVGSVEVSDPHLQRGFDRPSRVGLSDRAIGTRQAHRSQTDRRHGGTLGCERALEHFDLPSRLIRVNGPPMPRRRRCRCARRAVRRPRAAPRPCRARSRNRDPPACRKRGSPTPPRQWSRATARR